MKWRWYHYCIFVISLFIIAFLIYFPHLNYKYPLKYDEWHNIAKGVHYLNKGFQEDKDFINQPLNEKSSTDYEIGAHLILSFFFLFLDPILHTKYLPVVFAIFTSLILFYFLYKDYRFWTGIFAILFFASLKNNVNISGPWFLTPQAMAFPLVYLFLFLFEKKGGILSILTYLVLLLIHPLTAIILFLPSLCYSIIYFKRYKKETFILILILLLLSVIGIKLLWGGSIFNTISKIFDLLTFQGYPLSKMIKFYIPTFYGIISFFLAIVSFFILIKQRKILLPLTVLYSLILLFLNHNLDLTIISPYNRLFYMILLLLVPMSAIGLKCSLDYLQKKLKNKKIFIIITILIIFVTFIFSFYNYFPTSSALKPYYLIDDIDYQTLKWFESNYGSHNKIIVPLNISDVIYPISRNYPHKSFFISGNPDNFDFFKKDCGLKESIIRFTKSNFILSPYEIKCENLVLEKIYKNKKYFIYKILF